MSTLSTGTSRIWTNTVDPGVSEPNIDQGNFWLNTTSGTFFVNEVETVGVQVWDQFAGGGMGTSLSPYIVGATLSDFTTISAAITQAVADGASNANEINIYIKPGTYTENVTLADGVNLLGMDYRPSSNESIGVLHLLGVELVGTITVPSSVNCKVNNINVVPASGNPGFNVTSTVSGLVQLSGCRARVTNEAVINSNGANNLSSFFLINNCELSAVGTGTFLDISSATGCTLTIDALDSSLSGDASVNGISDATLTLSASNTTMNFALSGSGSSLSNIFPVNGSTWTTNRVAPLITGLLNGSHIEASYSTLAAGGVNLIDAANAQVILTYCNADTTIISKQTDHWGTIVPDTGGRKGFAFKSTSNTFKGTYSTTFQAVGRTVNAATVTIATIPLVSNEMISVDGLVCGFDNGFTASVGGTLNFVARNTAGVASIVGLQGNVQANDGAFALASFQGNTSGANIIIEVTGVAGFTINWSIEYTVLHTQSNS